MSDALSQLNALLAAAAAQQQQQLLLQLQQQNQQHQQQQNPLFQQFQLNQQQNQHSTTSYPPGNMPVLTEQALQSFLFAQQLQKQQQHQEQQNKSSHSAQQQQSIINSINSDTTPKNAMSLDSVPLPLLSQIQNNPDNIRPEFFNLQQQQQQQQQQNNKNYFVSNSTENSNIMNEQQKQQQQQNDENLDILNEFNKISLNDSNSKASVHNNTNNTSNNNNTSSNFDSSLLSVNDSEIYSADQNYMPGTASLIEDVDKLLMVVLRDGKTLIGYLRSIDQYANLLLSSTIERIHVGNKYGDIPRGIYIVRGENVVLIGEVDFNIQPKVEMIKVEVNEILELQRIEQKKFENEKSKKKSLTERCLMPQTDAVLDEYY